MGKFSYIRFCSFLSKIVLPPLPETFLPSTKKYEPGARVSRRTQHISKTVSFNRKVMQK